jgi:glycosyltransferase involved in cell wall biosynthesis
VKILFLHKQILFPHDTGGKIRALNVLRHLARWHEVTYLCNLRRGEERYLPEMRALNLRVEAVPGEAAPRGGARFYAGIAANLLSDRPFSIARNYDRAVRRRLARLLAEDHYDVLICDCPQMALHARGLRADANILFQHNVEAQILRRHAESSTGRLKSAYMRSQWRRMERFERDCGRWFDAVIAVSEPDRDAFRRDYGWPDVYAIDTAVDTEFFPQAGPPADPNGVLFLGSLDWLPNEDGLKFFAGQVWPAVRAARPDAVFRIVGRNPSPGVRALADRPGIELVGGVPDVRPHLAKAAVVVVPLLVGGGTRLKIFEAMASGRAVVSTTVGAEGLPVVHGKHFLRADKSEAFAEAVVRLLDDTGYRDRLAGDACRLVHGRFGSEAVARQFEGICREVLGRKVDSRSAPARV